MSAAPDTPAEAITLKLAAEWPPKALAETFAAQLAELGVALPVTTTTEDIGVVIDASGRDLLTIDVNGTRPDADAALIAGYVALAINMMGGARKPDPVADDAPARDKPTLTGLLDQARAHPLTDAGIAAQRRAWVIGELMLDDPDLTRDQALALIAEAETENANPNPRTAP